MNLSETYPIDFQGRVAAVETAVGADEAALFGTGTGTSVDHVSTALITPLNVAVSQGGTAGSTAYTYVVADIGNGGTRAPATGVATSTGAATLTTANYNIVTWASIPGHVYNVYRSASSGTPSGLGLVGTVTATGLSSTFNDTGITETAATIPTANTTGALVPAGPIFPSAPVFQWANVQSLSTDGNATLTVANIASRIFVRTGTATPTDTLPTAAAIVAAFRGLKVNDGIVFNYRNRASATATVAVGTGGSSATGNTLTVATSKSKDFLIQLTNVSAGTEAYTLYSLGIDSAF